MLPDTLKVAVAHEQIEYLTKHVQHGQIVKVINFDLLNSADILGDDRD
jgi:hypothetical protein